MIPPKGGIIYTPPECTYNTQRVFVCTRRSITSVCKLCLHTRSNAPEVVRVTQRVTRTTEYAPFGGTQAKLEAAHMSDQQHA